MRSRRVSNLAQNQGFLEQNHKFDHHSIFKKIKNAKGLHFGDVLVSKSGNFRLVIKTEENADQKIITFLSWMQGESLSFQKAIESKIDKFKILAIIRRTDCSPLVNFIEEMKNISFNKNVISNLHILLGLNTLGTQFNKARHLNISNKSFCTEIGISLCKNGQFKEILCDSKYHPKKIKLKIAKENSLEKEFISQVKVFPGINQSEKMSLILTVILSNLFQNAKQLVKELNIT